MLTVAMIVKDEINTLRQTVETVREHVDHIVIGVDNSSSDGSRALAEKLADIVITTHLDEELAADKPINGNITKDWGFSRARNQVIAACPEGSWTFTLDGHEFVQHPERLKGIVEKAIIAKCDAVEVESHDAIDSDGIPGLILRQARLLGPDVRYNNPNHNAPAFKAKCQTDEIIIDHHRELQAPEARVARDAQRARANVAGFKLKVQENPEDSRSWFYLGNAYKQTLAWKKASKAYKKYLTLKTWRDERCHALIYLGTCYLNLQRKYDAREAFVQASEVFPGMAEPYYYLAEMAYKEKHYREAQVWLEKCIQLEMPYTTMFLKPRIYLVDRYDLLSMVYFHLHEPAKAIEQAEKALKSANILRIADNINTWWKPQIEKHGDNAERYDEIWAKSKGPSPFEIERLKKMAEGLGVRKRVLDIGCGPAWIKEYLLGKPDYVGVDISDQARKAVEDKGGVAYSSMDDIDSFLICDGCILGEVLEHIEDDKGFLLKVKSCLPSGAVVIISVPRFSSMYDPAHVRDYTDTELRDTLSILGKPEQVGLVGPWTIYKCEVD